MHPHVLAIGAHVGFAAVSAIIIYMERSLISLQLFVMYVAIVLYMMNFTQIVCRSEERIKDEIMELKSDYKAMICWNSSLHRARLDIEKVIKLLPVKHSSDEEWYDTMMDIV